MNALTEWTASPINTAFPFVQKSGEVLKLISQLEICLALLVASDVLAKKRKRKRKKVQVVLG
jgi:hypothetical protein